MDKFPLLWAGASIGELCVEQEALYTCFTACCRLPEEGLWCAWAVGEQGELRLGILEPAGEEAVIRRRFSRRMTAPLGSLLRGELRSAASAGADWEAAPEPEQLFRTPWLRRQLQGTAGVLIRRQEGRRELALPYDPRRAFPLEQLFCFARLRQLGEGVYVVYCFDQREWPVFDSA